MSWLSCDNIARTYIAFPFFFFNVLMEFRNPKLFYYLIYYVKDLFIYIVELYYIYDNGLSGWYA